MRSPHFALSLCLIVVGLTGSVRAADPTPATVWMTDFTKAQAEARRLHRPLVAHFGNSRTCPPCRQMEAEVLNTQPVLKLLDDGFVAVKVDLAKPSNGRFQTQFRIEAMPTDLILGYDGAELYRSEGYDGRTTTDRLKYRAALTRIDVAYSKDGKRLPRSEAAEEPANAVAQSSIPRTTPAVQDNSKVAGKIVPEPVEAHRIDVSEPAPAANPVATTVPKSTQAIVALDGYCPVTLRTTRSWKKGDRQYTVIHEGQTFAFLAADKRDEFQANPSRYAPKMYGCDPVVLAESKLPIRGSTKFGAYYDGELFLFETAENRSKFRKDPSRYRYLEHALRPDDVNELRSASTAGAK